MLHERISCRIVQYYGKRIGGGGGGGGVNSLICIENHLFIVGIGKILNKELKFIYCSDRSDCSDCSDRTCVNS